MTGPAALVAIVVVALGGCGRDRDSVRPLPTNEAKDAAPACAGKMCGTTCVDLSKDVANCGACGTTCPSTSGCAMGLCTSASGWAVTARAALGGGPSSPCEVGKRVAVRCPPEGAKSSVWGTDLYTDDCSVCTAAVHAGKITLAGGGDVALEIRAGAPSYAASTRNGITSSTWAAWGCSFVFPARECGPDARLCDGACIDLLSDPLQCGACGHACSVDESCRKGTCTVGMDATWTTTLSAMTCTPGAKRTFHCPPGVPPTPSPAVWGTSVYTHDSSLCTAAVHAGKITPSSGGTVVVELRAGEPTYKGTTDHGVTSKAYGPWRCSFVFR